MQALTREETAKFLQACKDASEEDWLMALLAYNHGLRVSELVGRWAVKRVKKQRVRYFHEGILAREVRNGSITVRRLKGSDVTRHPLKSDSDPLFSEKNATERLALIRRPNQQLFKHDRTTVWRRLQRHAKAAGINLSSASIRGMKHSLGTQASEKVPLKVLQLYMGHKKAESTLKYYDVTPEQAAERVQGCLGV